jgi:hypothetical protein
MHENDILGVFLAPLVKLNVKYMITGSMASIVYGEPRLTNDVDLVMELDPKCLDSFQKAFSEAEFYSPPLEVIKIECARRLRGHFNIIHHHTGFKADVYLAGDDPLHRWALEQRRQIHLENGEVWVAPPEYVILRKLQYYQEGQSGKHLRDIRTMLEVSKGNINLQWLKQRVQDLSLEQEWDLATKS